MNEIYSALDLKRLTDPHLSLALRSLFRTDFGFMNQSKTAYSDLL